jgi:signal transduction histidine kinase
MEIFRWIKQPRWLALLALVFAAVPVWVAWVSYHEAWEKDDRLFETTSEVLVQQLRQSTGRCDYLLGVLGTQARNLNEAALARGQLTSAIPGWQKQVRPLAALGYAEVVAQQLILRWKSEGRSAVRELGSNLRDDLRVAKQLDTIPADQRLASHAVLLDGHQWMILAPVFLTTTGNAIRGYIVGWVDLDAICQDEAVELVRKQVLTAVPLAENELAAKGGQRWQVAEDRLEWSVSISRGPNFSAHVGPPTPWLAFIAAGLSALPLLGLAMLASRAAQADAALTAEREVLRQQRFFTQSVSHEFRTPLGIILSAAELLESYAEQLTPKRRTELLGEIKHNTHHMTEMIERVLLLGKIDSSRLACEPKPINLAEFCQGMARQVSSASNQRNPINVDAPAVERSLDAGLLQSMLDNLLANAVKYSPPGEPVNLAVELEPNTIKFIVSDHGIGIPQAELSRLGVPFHRCGNVGEVPGSGLGLAIAQRCARLHGGTLSFESEEGKGTTAVLVLPTIS